MGMDPPHIPGLVSLDINFVLDATSRKDRLLFAFFAVDSTCGFHDRLSDRIRPIGMSCPTLSSIV